LKFACHAAEDPEIFFHEVAKMDFEKIKQWMEITQQYQNGKFWEMVFEEDGMENMMDDAERGVQKPKRQTRPSDFPKTDVFLTETDVILLMELPGALKDDIALSVSGTKLLVKGVLQPPMINGATVRTERKYGEFQRIIDLPEPTESRAIHARFENGLLIITYGRKFIREEPIMIR
jgi:HSP20 family protein